MKKKKKTVSSCTCTLVSSRLELEERSRWEIELFCPCVTQSLSTENCSVENILLHSFVSFILLVGISCIFSTSLFWPMLFSSGLSETMQKFFFWYCLTWRLFSSCIHTASRSSFPVTGTCEYCAAAGEIHRLRMF